MRKQAQALKRSATHSGFYHDLQRELLRHGEARNEKVGMQLGGKVREFRERRGLSGAELCRKTGSIDPRTLSAIEKGRIRNPSLPVLTAIAKALGCLVRDFFTEAEMDLARNYQVGSQKGVFQIEFPRLGMKVVSATPPIPHFFCGKIILSPQRKVTGELLSRPAPVFLEVVMGRIEFDIEGRKTVLKEGENLFFNGSLRHSFKNTLNRESTVWFVTAPSFFS